MNWTLELVILLIFLWVAAIIALAPRLSKTKNFQGYGPFLMVKLVKNRKILDRIANRFPGINFGRISVVIVVISAALALIMLTYGAYLSLFIKPSNAPSLSLLIAFPGINPAIPIGYGTASLIIAVVIHEIFHGIVARKHGIKVKSVGALFFIIPVGAFVEPDEEEVEKADPVHRRRLIASGPGINIVIAIATLVLLAFVLVPAATPTHSGTYVQYVTDGSPAANYISTGQEITSFGNYTGGGLNNLLLTSQLNPGQLYTVSVYNGNSTSYYELPAGVTIDSVTSGTPADTFGLKQGSVILSVNGNPVYNDTVLQNVLDGTAPGSNVTLVTEQYTVASGQLQGSKTTTNLTTMSKYDYYAQNYPSQNNPAFKNESFLGVTLTYAGILGNNLSTLQSILSGKSVFTNPWSGGLAFISLPFLYLYPVPAGLTSLFSVPFSAPLFWFLVNISYWLFWIDFLLGITNALPFLIFDGGQFFRDSLIIASRRERFKFLRDERNLKLLMNVASTVVLILLLWQIIVPRIL